MGDAHLLHWGQQHQEGHEGTDLDDLHVVEAVAGRRLQADSCIVGTDSKCETVVDSLAFVVSCVLACRTIKAGVMCVCVVVVGGGG